MSLFELTIVSESEILFSGKAEYCGITTLTGSMGFEANHEAFTGILKPDSDVEYIDDSGNRRKVSIQDGIILFKDNFCTITATL